MNTENLQIKPELITVTDDKKEKYQSFEATLSCDNYPSMSVATLYLVGYGDCEEEARANLNSTFQELIQGIVVAEEATNDDPGYNEAVEE